MVDSREVDVAWRLAALALACPSTAPRAPLPTGESKSRTSAVWMPRSLARSQWRRRVDVRWCVRRRRRAPAIRRPRRRPSACLRSTCPAERPWCGGDHADRRVDSSNFEDLSAWIETILPLVCLGSPWRGPETEPDHCPVYRQPTHRLPSLNPTSASSWGGIRRGGSNFP